MDKLDFKDIMKEDFHPSLNFAEITERSLQFVEKSVIKRGQIGGWGILESVLSVFTTLDGVLGGNRWLLAVMMSFLNFTYVLISLAVMPPVVTKEHDSLKEEVKHIG